jgi:cytochrome P450
MDGEPHVIMRKAFNDRFSVGGIGELEQLIRDCAVKILNDVLPRGKCDFTVDIAGRLPLAVISAMMDLPEADWDDLYRWNNMSAAPEDPEWSVGTPLETSQAGTINLVQYCAKLAMERRGGGGNDLLSALARTEVNGELLSPDKLGFNGLMFFAAGHETTRAALSSALLELMRDPAQWRALREKRHDPDAIKAVAEEGVRWASPLTHTLRTATEDTIIGGQKVKEGDWVVVWLASANRDEKVFADPHRFDSARTPNNHLGFAIGKHHCLGAHLARAEMRILLEYLLEHMPEPPQLAGEPQMAASTLFWGVKHMPITYKPGAQIAQ